MASKIRGKVTGVIVTSTASANALAKSGIPVAFGSGAEEGAADLPFYVASGVHLGLSPAVVVQSLTADAATILGIEDRVGRLAPGRDGDILLLDGSPLDISSKVLRVWIDGEEIE